MKSSTNDSISATGQILVFAGREIRSGFSSKAYRIAAVIAAILVFAIPPLIPKLLTGFALNEKTVAVVGSAENRRLFLQMDVLPPTMRHEELDQLPADHGEYDLIVDASASPVALKTEKLSQMAAFQQLVPAIQLYQERQQGMVTGPPPPVGLSYDRDDSREFIRTFMAFMISLAMLMFLIGFSGFVLQGVFADKNSRLVDVLYPKSSALRLLVGKVLGVGAFGWLQLFFLATLTVSSLALFTDFDWQQFVLPPVAFGLAWFVFGYAFVAFIAAALASLVRSAPALAIAQIPLYAFNFAAYFSGYIAIIVNNDMSAPWVRWLGLFPPFSATLIPAQIATGTADAGYLITAAAVSGACVLLVAIASARVYQRCIIGRPVHV